MKRLHPIIRWLIWSLVGVFSFTLVFIIKGNGQILPLPDYFVPQASSSATPNAQSDDVRTLLVLINHDDGSVSSATLLVRSQSATTLGVYSINTHTIIDLHKAKLIDIHGAGRESGALGIQRGIQMASGVRIDGTLLLKPLALSALVDSVGGVDINVSRPINVSSEPQQSGNAISHTILQGQQHLSGTEAAHYVLVTVAGEGPQQRYTRTTSVLRATFDHLPHGVQHLSQTLAELGSAASTTVPTVDVATFLALIQQRDAWRTAKPSELSTVAATLNLPYLPKGQSFALSDIMMSVGKKFPEVMVTGNQNPYRVLVVGPDANARLSVRKQLLNSDRLTGADFEFVDGTSGEVIDQTVFYAPDSVSQDVANQLAERLNLVNPLVMRVGNTTEATYGADFVVTLGKDYQSISAESGN